MHRSNWQPEELQAKIETCLNDPAMQAKMAETSAHMRQFNGPERAAGLLDQLLKDNS
jgi:UDP:flavonoid glycosyltransferase YjiC (YdhE family)